VAYGTVHWKGKTPYGESYISIEHENGLRTTYMPILSSLSKDQVVKQGDSIGTVLSGGYSSPVTHLHFGIKVPPYGPDDYLNPLTLLPSLEAQSENQESSSTSVAPVGGSISPGPSVSPAQTRDVTTVQTEAGLPASSNEPLSVLTVPMPNNQNYQQIVNSAKSPQAPNFSVSTANPSGAVSTNSSPLLPQANKVGQETDNLKEPLFTSSRKFEEANLTSSKKAHPGSLRPISADAQSCTEERSNPWQIALLSIAFVLTLLFILKKKILSFFSSHQILKPAFLKSAFL
jgi:hypothetical protein